jgi:hypothetical protein
MLSLAPDRESDLLRRFLSSSAVGRKKGAREIIKGRIDIPGTIGRERNVGVCPPRARGALVNSI